MPTHSENISKSGLTAKEAEKRLARDGYNELSVKKQHPLLALLWEVVREPMLLLLLAAGAIYFLLGDVHDALLLSTFVVALIGITFFQKRKTERALEALKELSSPQVLVIRDDIQLKIPGREVVAGDILILREGDRVAADCAILENANLTLDESLLTGESLGVSKIIWNGESKLSDYQPGGGDLPVAYSGTLVTRGHGLAQVLATGERTEIGKIGQSLGEIHEEPTLLKKEISRLVKIFGGIGLALCAVVVLLYGILKGDWLESLLYGITVGMSVLPEEFPVVVLIFLTLGAWLLSRKKVLTRDSAVIETLGAARVLCVDKTGTLTENKMRLQALLVDDSELEILGDQQTINLTAEYQNLLKFSLLASPEDLFDPLEKEIQRAAKSWLPRTELIAKNWRIIKEYPFSKTLMALANVWDEPENERYIIAAKGAPEAIIDLCHFSPAQAEKFLARLKPLMEQGLRMLGVAQVEVKRGELPNDLHDFEFEFVGVIGFADPIRHNVPKAVTECYRAGIRVCMITGDYPGTAQAIARKIGLKNPENFLTGDDLQKLDPAELKRRIALTNVFARVIPEQKMLIINALKNNGEIIAMTGDGVNDAPALKAANIGIAMGERGTDVAREAADLVLMNDDFSSIVQGVRTGRTIFDNLKKALRYITAIHVPIAGMAFLPLALNLPIVFFPAHIAFLEMIIDPSCSLIFQAEKEEKNVMNRPPRNLKTPLFNRRALLMSLLQGLGVLAIVLVAFIIALSLGKNPAEARTVTFLTLVILNLVLIITNLSATKNFFQIIANKNKTLGWIVLIVVVAMFLVATVPFLRDVFRFAAPNFNDIILILGAGVVGLIWLEGLKWAMRKISSKSDEYA